MVLWHIKQYDFVVYQSSYNFVAYQNSYDFESYQNSYDFVAYQNSYDKQLCTRASAEATDEKECTFEKKKNSLHLRETYPSQTLLVVVF